MRLYTYPSCSLLRSRDIFAHALTQHDCLGSGLSYDVFAFFFIFFWPVGLVFEFRAGVSVGCFLGFRCVYVPFLFGAIFFSHFSDIDGAGQRGGTGVSG